MKRKRQEKIIQIINEYDIETQEELAGYLHDAGYAVTQATVSRDIRELSLVKIPGVRGKQRYMTDSDSGGGGSGAGLERRYISVLQDGVVSMEQAGNLLVIKTVSGMAMAVAAAVDAMHLEDIVGSIAGDDTIMCAIKQENKVSAVMARMKEQINN